MNWEAVSAIAEVIGVVVVVISLAYVAVQIRQNTIATRNQTTYELVSAVSDATHMVSLDAELAKIVGRGIYDRESLTSEEQFRFNTYFFGYVNRVEYAYDQYKSKGLEEKAWRKLERELPIFLSLPGASAWWRQDKIRFSEEFVQYLDERIAEKGAVDAVPTVPPLSDVSDGSVS
ncbi:MAG: hypothetical protein ACU84Q_06570 [Gammaproteobacteria bacterium]